MKYIAKYEVLVYAVIEDKINQNLWGFFMRKINKSIGRLVEIIYGAYKRYISKEPPKYSVEWIEGLTEEEWEVQRENIRQKMCNPRYDDATRIRYQNILRLFDKVKSDRDWAGRKPQGPAYHREHGNNLYKP